MMTSRAARNILSCLIIAVVAAGLFGNTGFTYAADRTVLGELWSADN